MFGVAEPFDQPADEAVLRGELPKPVLLLDEEQPPGPLVGRSALIADSGAHTLG